MTEIELIRRVLIVDDQQEIHETFRRVFAEEESKDSALSAFESEFLDDSESNHTNAKSVKPRYSLVHVHSGEEALIAVGAAADSGNPYNVAFVDMRMPGGMDGLETVEQLWRVDPCLQVVICTAHSDHTWDEVLERLGYNDQLLLLKKPFESNEARQAALALSEKWHLSAIQKQKFDDLQTEIERRRAVEEKLRTIAHRDALTSLPNRPYLLTKLDSILKDGSWKSKLIALLFLDLDNFKVINDSLGHDAGDDLLNQVAVRLKECVRHNRESDSSEDETIRLGGDEFVILMDCANGKEDALIVGRRVVKRLSDPFRIGDRLVNVGTSVGVAYLSSELNDAHELLRNADTAMYQAKNSGKGQIAIFDQTMHEAAVARHELESELRIALQKENFELKYQPIIDLKRATIAGVEVLMRWRANDDKYVPPDEFIPIAEEIGLIQDIGEWVLRTMMQEFGALLRSLPPGIDRNVYAAVNVSRRQLCDPYFIDSLNETIAETEFDRSLLKLEMSETGDPRQQARSLQTMMALHESGIGIHIDDFGKGKSSLACFKDYPVETVKIDRSFCSAITTEYRHRVITESLIKLTHQLDSTLVCEGIESLEQLKLLQEWKCDLAQGYFFAPPIGIEQLESLLKHPQQSEGLRALTRHQFPNLNIQTNAGDLPQINQ